MVLGFLFSFALAEPVVHAAKAADNATELKAREAFAAGRYEDALNLFAKLYAETLHPVYLRNIGRCHQKLRAYANGWYQAERLPGSGCVSGCG